MKQVYWQTQHDSDGGCCKSYISKTNSHNHTFLGHFYFYFFIYLFYIPLTFTHVELVIYIVSIVDKQVYIVVPYCNITVSIVDKISTHKLCLNLLVTRCTNKYNIQQLYVLSTLYLCVL
jgi:hypothetical protein